MARFDTTGMDEIIREMQRMGEQTGEVAEAMIMTGAAYVRMAWRQSAEEHGHRETGDLIDSIDYARKPKDIGGSLSIDIYPQGKDHKGVRNAEKAFILHYGTSKRKGSRWVDRADELSDLSVVPAMTRVWETYLETGQIKTEEPRYIG